MTPDSSADTLYLKQALELATTSPERIGCGVIIVQNSRILAQTTNSQRTDNIAVNHAEIKAIIAANTTTGSRTLPGATAYCSCEPCAMCLTALSYAKIPRIVFAASMADLFPDDPQSTFNSAAYIQGLNFIPELIRLKV